ncbi:GNAT family N-acetyltransferase [Legionella jordanis]|uniref:GNAT family acetyltransferase n=1 Tax=Legionella jordanis TaxID=456 RepID=A0A0W0V898_9GAMM|nr:GNAT family N-acetyltransferase [Legionella jordanis]KTD16314.1 GNAT family acetyltransferase [Legionella jordanis]RMX04473.1 GNAT family N-acetyltransferase [Legionella jordanis]VEH12228.1 GNAT family acetyltransferase [Legionella jordanis]
MHSPLIQFFYECEQYFFESISIKSGSLDEGSNVYITDVPISSLNLLVLYKKPTNMHDFFSKYDQFFSRQQLPWSAVISDHFLDNDMAFSEVASYFNHYESATPMVIQLHDDLQPQYQKDNCLIKGSNEALQDWMQPLIEAFNSTLELTAIYLGTHQHALGKKAQLQHLTLYVNDRPISSLTVSRHKNLARIDDFGTLPAYQGQGFGRHLLTYTLNQLKNTGVEFCFLESAQGSLSLYKKMGFKPLFNRRYLWDFKA